MTHPYVTMVCSFNQFLVIAYLHSILTIFYLNNSSYLKHLRLISQARIMSHHTLLNFMLTSLFFLYTFYSLSRVFASKLHCYFVFIIPKICSHSSLEFNDSMVLARLMKCLISQVYYMFNSLISFNSTNTCALPVPSSDKGGELAS